MRPQLPKGPATEITITFQDGSSRRLSGDDAARWFKSIGEILVWLSPIRSFRDERLPSWEKIDEASHRVTVDDKTLAALRESIADRARRIEELEAEVQRLRKETNKP